MDMETTIFFNALKIMGIGMAGILTFMVLFGGVIVLLHKAFPANKESKVDE